MTLRKVLACRAGALALGTAFLVAGTVGVQADECETITLGAAISLTGKYATNGYHTQHG